MKNKRNLFQLAFTVVTNGYVAGIITGKIFKGNTKRICVPGLNCYSCPGALGSCPIGSLQAVISSAEYKFSFYVVGILIFFGGIFGRLICGWACPFGLVQDLCYKIPFFKKTKKIYGDKFLRYLKYIILVVFVILLPMYIVDIIGQGSPWFCKYICPSGTLTAGLPLIIKNPELRQAIGWIFIWKNLLLVITLILSIKIYRPFCKYICPLGGIYGVFNHISLYKYRIDNEKCTKCGACANVCPMGVKTFTDPNSIECIRCGVCKDICPEKAISSGYKK